MKFYSYLYLPISVMLIASAVFSSCTDVTDELHLDEQQAALLGTAVNFSVSMADPFQTRTTYQENGTFNEQDMMRIYRQCWDKTSGTWGEDAYRTYYYYTQYATGTNIILERDWRIFGPAQLNDNTPNKNRRTGYNSTADAYHDVGTFTQTEADSLTWDDGRTIRFRAWSRSNYDNCLYASESDTLRYYPDYCVAEWVNVSGPTISIPLVLKHLGSRIGFSPISGNQLHMVEICTDWQDYKWKDNSDEHSEDTSTSESKKPDEQAKAECAEVLAAYNRMCMPAGVEEDDKGHFVLKSFLKDQYKVENLNHLEDKTGIFYSYGENTNSYIKTNVKRPMFGNVNGSSYLITIPYDMSNESTQGDVITLPACTRFRVYVRDINNGDHHGTGGFEGKYHIFTLSDIKETDASGNVVSKYPNGLEMLPGYSYKFNVGYLYDKFTITPVNELSWDLQNTQSGTLTNQAVVPDDFPTTGYTWWKQAIADAIPTGNDDYNPVFHISTLHEFMEFIRLVNGEAAINTNPLYHLVHHYDETPSGLKVPVYGWSTVNDQRRPQWITKEEAEAEGYLFYEHYYPIMGDRGAYSEEDYLRGPFSFYDGTLHLQFEVNLENDLDLNDWLIDAIGNKATTPFMGNFNGNNHVLSNVNVQGEALFANILSATVRNLQIRSTHATTLVGSGTVDTRANYIVGISMQAPTVTNSIARSLIGQAYVVGCIHQSDYKGNSGALVGTADELAMSGCMQAASGITGGALLSAYAAGADAFFAPRLEHSKMVASEVYSQRPTWSNFMCNYYDTELSPGTTAVGGVADDYSLWEYIRGRKSHILKAKNDNFIGEEMPLEVFFSDSTRVAEYYGLAPWKAMNYAIMKYNREHAEYRCDAHYVSNSNGYGHQYPVLVAGAAGSGDGTGLNYDKIDPLKQTN